MNTLITADEARTLGRPIGKVASEKILAFISEVEQTIIRRKLGDVLYLKLIKTDHTTDTTYATLLDGGEYTDTKGSSHFLAGLKIAESYYVWAQNVRAGDFESTRYGMVHKDGEYSSPISTKERDASANTATEIGDAYMQEVLDYCIDQNFLDPKDSRLGLGLTAGCIIRKIKK